MDTITTFPEEFSERSARLIKQSSKSDSNLREVKEIPLDASCITSPSLNI